MRALRSGLLFAVAALSYPASARGSSATCTVTVEQGDTLSGIAAKHGVSERALIQANESLRKNPDLLRIGQELDICEAQRAAAKTAEPAAKATSKRCGKSGRLYTHEVSQGDTLSRIAHEYGVTEAEIQRRNAALQRDPNALRIGQSVEVCVETTRPRNHKLCAFETPLHFHSVVPGEHLGQIAGRYGVRKADLVRLNAGLRENPNMLSVGKEIRVCPQITPHERHKISYAVQSGDTIGSIAKRYGLTPNELIRYQEGRLEDPNALREGQPLRIWVDGDVVTGFSSRDEDTGVLKSGMQLPPGSHYVVKTAGHAWGTSKTIRVIQSAIASYQRRKPGGPKIHVGDISRRGGGRFPPHLSHQHGRDVDIGYVLTGALAHETRFRSANSSNFDVARSWTLLKAFLDTNEVRYIFVDYRLQKALYEYARDHGVSEETLDELMQYPRGSGRSHGIIRHWKGHVNHFHVRFAK